MRMCSDCHPEIVYDTKYCPLCEVIAEKESVERELEATQELLEDANATIQSLSQDLRYAESQIS